MPSGNTSLYLDIYVDGQRRYEYLKLYLSPDRRDKEKNRDTLRLAEAIRAKRLVEIRNGMYGFKGDGKSGHISFIDFFAETCAKKDKPDNHSTYMIWKSALMHLKDYLHGRKLMLSAVDAQWLRGFKEHLQGLPLSQNTKAQYYAKVCTCLRAAFDEGLIRETPIRKAGGRIEMEEVERMYLTLEELKRLAATPCRHGDVRQAFLFSCLTGLRKSDVGKLTWGDVKKQGAFTRIFFRQKKTGGREYADIPAEAAALMGERADDSVHLFTLPSNVVISAALREWVRAAGINKRITFHCARHTFAVMMLDLGTDIYTVSKLLGHRNLTTTQIYAKVLDKNKQAAVSRIPSILGGGEVSCG